MHSSEQLRIDTPEQIALEFPLAGIGSRFLAIAIDTLLQLGIFIVLGVAVVFGGPAIARLVPGLGAWLTFVPAAAIFFAFCVYWGYFSAFEIFWKGQTPGKRIAGIRVIRESGRPIDASAAILRNLVRVIDLMPGMYGVAVICMLLNKQSRRLGDFVAGTVVVHDRQPVDVGADWKTRSDKPRASPMAIRVTEEELVLIEAYLDRRPDLGYEVADKTASLIAHRITERTGAQPEPGQKEHDFLEAVARQARDAARFR